MRRGGREKKKGHPPKKRHTRVFHLIPKDKISLQRAVIIKKRFKNFNWFQKIEHWFENNKHV